MRYLIPKTGLDWISLLFKLQMVCVIGAILLYLGMTLISPKEVLTQDFRLSSHFMSDVQHQGKVYVSLDEAVYLWKNKKAIFFDARQNEAYQKGHVTGAINVPYNSKNIQEEVGKYKDSLIVIYCQSHQCDYSEKLYFKLAHLEFASVVIYKGGYKSWKRYVRDSDISDS